MVNTKQNEAPKSENPVAEGINIGLAIGVAIGIVIGNLAIGIGVGIGVGAAIGAARKKRSGNGGSKD